MTTYAASATPPVSRNEPVRDYAPGSPERKQIEQELRRQTDTKLEFPSIIGGRAVTSGKLEPAVMPHNHAHVLGNAHLVGANETRAAIAASQAAWPSWSRLAWQDRAAVFLKAADLLAGPWRARLNVATMLGQAKTVHQAEIDAAAELIDFWRVNVGFLQGLYAEQPQSPPGFWNWTDYRPLEGFIYAITPFNFTAIAGNLPTAPALMGNTVVWKPSPAAKLSAHLIMELLREAGLPDGVINLVYGDAAEISDVALSDPALAGVHFTGSTDVFNQILRKLAQGGSKNYPRVVGETGGKNFVVAHPSAAPEALATAIVRGGYEYQGQKCSAASRVFVPQSLWPSLKERLVADIASIRMGDVADFRNFMSAVIHERSWKKLSGAQEEAKKSSDTKVIAGGSADSSRGYFVQPTLLETSNPRSRFMTEEFFGPIVTAHVFPDNAYEQTLKLIDESSAYGLTGAVFARDRSAIALAHDKLRYAAGNFYINDKPTGAVVGQQPFGGARASGTNDKAGSVLNLLRWVSPRSVKETFVPPTEYRYPFMGE